MVAVKTSHQRIYTIHKIQADILGLILPKSCDILVATFIKSSASINQYFHRFVKS